MLTSYTEPAGSFGSRLVSIHAPHNNRLSRVKRKAPLIAAVAAKRVYRLGTRPPAVVAADTCLAVVETYLHKVVGRRIDVVGMHLAAVVLRSLVTLEEIAPLEVAFGVRGRIVLLDGVAQHVELHAVVGYDLKALETYPLRIGVVPRLLRAHIRVVLGDSRRGV